RRAHRGARARAGLGARHAAEPEREPVAIGKARNGIRGLPLAHLGRIDDDLVAARARAGDHLRVLTRVTGGPDCGRAEPDFVVVTVAALEPVQARPVCEAWISEPTM